MAVKWVKKSYWAIPTVALPWLLFISNTASAQTNWQTIITYSDRTYQEEEPETITQVHRLRDVSPSDWAYEALRSLSDRYFDARSLAPAYHGYTFG